MNDARQQKKVCSSERQYPCKFQAGQHRTDMPAQNLIAGNREGWHFTVELSLMPFENPESCRKEQGACSEQDYGR